MVYAVLHLQNILACCSFNIVITIIIIFSFLFKKKRGNERHLSVFNTASVYVAAYYSWI
uniref:Uncharacterized protein n=1 Tax=Rhizophora mucronata TaxID=61149 RepID=A0A2P2M0L5_RHIMU